MKKEQWIADKKKTIFPFQYFHVVFTLPHQLIPLFPRNKKILYDLLFQTVRETLLSTADEKKYFGARIGFFSILHTWGQKLNLHPHLHCVVPGGGLAGNQWIKSPRNFLLPVLVLKKRFQSLFLRELKKLHQQKKLDLTGSEFSCPEKFQGLIDLLFSTEWVVYLKESFRNSDSVIEYLGRYTHRIAISNYRIRKIENGLVTFSYKDYSQENQSKEMVLPAERFIRRFLLHVLPTRFVRIRYYGLLSNRNRKKNLENCCQFYSLPAERNKRTASAWDVVMLRVTGIDIHKCPVCRKGRLVEKQTLVEHRYRPPPAEQCAG
jgi:hypothetical protein